jgi:nucleoside-diphosphate-sugar epimerase
LKVLLTGATGFIGSHVARALVRASHEVHAIVRPDDNMWRIQDILPALRVIRANILDSAFSLQPSVFDACIHLAWYVEPGKYLEAPENKQWVEASLRLARTLKDSGCRRFVAAGTCFEYAPSDPPQRETSHTEPSTLYVQSKLELFHALQTVGIEFAWVRFFYQYGPQEDPRRLVPVIINSLLNAQEAKLVAGDRTRDYLYIEDVASAVCAVAQSKITGAVNIGSSVPITVRDVALKIGNLLDRVDLIKVGALPYSASEPMHLLADNTKLRQGTGWRPGISLNDGLRQTVDWWKSQQRPKPPTPLTH